MSNAPDRIVLVYDADSGLVAMALDVLKKAVGREDCALCEITYSPIGKRGGWKACERRLGTMVDELHRDRIPPEWGLAPADLPCILARRGVETPFVLVTRSEIDACGKRIDALERRIRSALDGLAGVGRCADATESTGVRR